MMRIDILTLFPEMCGAAFRQSILARAVEKGLLQIACHQIRDYTTDRQGKVDDYPYGGGPGLIMSYQPVRAAYDDVVARFADGKKPHTVYMSPQGTPLTQAVARRLSRMPHLVILCGHYEGIDERILEDFIDEEISLGDFVLTGGEIPAMALTDCVARLVPGVLASDEATESESHTDLLLEYPQYTRPETIAGMRVPEVLLGGNHADVERWRLEQAIARTARKRPDLHDAYIKRQRESSTFYFDNSATTPPLDSVTETVRRTAAELYANPSSLHGLGMRAEKALGEARRTVAAAIEADEREIFFTSGATEANNWVFQGIVPANPRKGTHILISAVEHLSVSEAAAALTARGYTVEKIPVDGRGIADPARAASMVRPDTALVSVMHVNSETGAIQPVREIADAVRAVRPEVLIHADCVQSLLKTECSVRSLGVDLLSASAHKIHGPRGVGFLYVRRGVRCAPLLYGGGQEGGMRSGTENLAGICGMAEAIRVLEPNMRENAARARRMRDIFLTAIRNTVRTYVCTTPLERPEESSPYILNVSFPGLRAEVLQHSLETRGIYVSVGSACSSHKKGRSAVLTAMGCNNKVIDGAIRISFSAMNTEEQANYAADALTRTVRELYAQMRQNRERRNGEPWRK